MSESSQLKPHVAQPLQPQSHVPHPQFPQPFEPQPQVFSQVPESQESQRSQCLNKLQPREWQSRELAHELQPQELSHELQPQPPHSHELPPHDESDNSEPAVSLHEGVSLELFLVVLPSIACGLLWLISSGGTGGASVPGAISSPSVPFPSSSSIAEVV